MNRPVFPFTAIVGQENMKLALILNAINPKLGGVLIRGQKGTAKSTAARALAQLLPEVEAVAVCPFGCDPDDMASLCEDCARPDAAALPRQTGRVPFVELPVGATEDRVAGTLDLEHAISEGRRRFEPGLLAAANRGVLYVDEVNLLNDHLVDVLLDVAAMGRNYVEREGISFSHPAQFMLVGTMNPEEGDLRPQLLDRFALAVEVEGATDTQTRVEVVRRRLAFEADPAAFTQAWSHVELAERDRILASRKLLPRLHPDDDLLGLVAHICAAYEVDGMRADIVMVKAALTLASYHGREHVTEDDVRAAAELALLHRRRRRPFDEAGFDRDGVERAIDEHRNGREGGPHPLTPSPSTTDGEGEATAGDEVGDSELPGDTNGGTALDRTFAVGNTFDVRRIESTGPARRADPPEARAGRRERVASASRGYHVRAVPAAVLPGGALALDATLRAAAPFQQERRERRLNDAPAILLERSDLQVKLRQARTGNLIVLLVDTSGSMAAAERMVAVKGAVASLLLDAYRKRDRIAVITFRDEDAQVALPPTNSVELAQRLLPDMAVGGRTPLAHGLLAAAELIERAGMSGSGNDAARPLLVVLSDGRANVPLIGHDAIADAHAVAARLRGRAPALVIDTEAGYVRFGLAGALAEALGAPCLRIDELDATRLAAAIRTGLE